MAELTLTTIGSDPLERALVVTAHPDDVDFGAAGTVSALTGAGVHVTYCIVTNGDAGGSDRSVSRTDMAELRQAEQTAAAKEVGVDDIHFLGFPDGRVVASLELRAAISRVIRIVKPQLVITQSPTRNLDRIYASHPDHLAAGEAALCAVYPDARNPFAFPELLADEGLEPWSVPEVWLMSGGDATHTMDITDHLDRKVSALMRHVSQLPDPTSTDARMRAWGAELAKQFGLPEGRAAEAFRRVETR